MALNFSYGVQLQLCKLCLRPLCRVCEGFRLEKCVYLSSVEAYVGEQREGNESLLWESPTGLLHYRRTEIIGEVAVGERWLEKMYLQEMAGF